MATAVTPRPDAPTRDRLLIVRQHLPRNILRSVPPATWARAGVVLASVVVAVGVVGRFLAPGGLWLDEALSVNISKLPLQQLPRALVQDGSPPLYYVLLHFWMFPFGQGDLAVRSLSGVVSAATLPFLWAAGLRAGGRRTAWAALLLGASSPWAIYYGTDTRMYSLMALEAVLWYLAVARALQAPSRGRLVAVAAVTAALIYTHYWDLYLVAVGCAWLLWRWWHESRTGEHMRYASPGAMRKTLWAMAAGVGAWLPWTPVFLYQMLHTGTPWAGAPGPANLLSVFNLFSGPGPWGELLTFLLFSLAGLALFAKVGPHPTSVIVEMRVQPRARLMGLLVVGTLSMAVAVGMVTGAAFDGRYIAVVFPLFALLCALGLSTFASRRVTAALLALACVAGLLSAKVQNSQPRTQAVTVAADLNLQAQPGDMVVYCPDQLGPAVSRLLKVPDVTQLTFPNMIGPQRVDWVNYASAIQAHPVANFAQAIMSRLNPGNTLWLVWRDGYRGFGTDCGFLESWFQMYMPDGQSVVTASSHYYESENLVQFRN